MKNGEELGASDRDWGREGESEGKEGRGAGVGEGGEQKG